MAEKRLYEKPVVQKVKLEPKKATLSNCNPGEKMTRPWLPCLYTCNKEKI